MSPFVLVIVQPPALENCGNAFRKVIVTTHLSIKTIEDVLTIINSFCVKDLAAPFPVTGKASARWPREDRPAIRIRGQFPLQSLVPHYILGIILAALAPTIVVNWRLWQKDARSFYQHFY